MPTRICEDFLQPVVQLRHLVEIKPVDAGIARQDGREAAHIERRIDADALMADADAESVLGLGDGVLGGALRQRGRRRQQQQGRAQRDAHE